MYLTFFHTHNFLIGLLQRIFFSLTLYCRSKTRLAKSVEWLGWAVRYSFPGRENKFFCSPKTPIISETEPASYPMRTGFLSLGMKRPWRETDCSLSSSTEAKNYYWGYNSIVPYAYALKAFKRPSSIYVNGRVSGPRTLQGKKLPRVPHVDNMLSTRISEPWVSIKPKNSTSLVKDLSLDKNGNPHCTVLTHSLLPDSVTAASPTIIFFYRNHTDGWTRVKYLTVQGSEDTAFCYFHVLQLTRNTGLQISMKFASQVCCDIFECLLEVMLLIELLNSIFVSTVSQILIISYQYNCRYN